MFFSRYAKFMFAPDMGADGGAGVGETVATEVDNTDYKALYEREVASRARDKKSFDQTASELAALKKANRDKMSEEEKREAELAEEREYWQSMANELNAIKVANIFAKQGYAEDDYANLSKSVVKACGAKAHEVAEAIVDFVKKATKDAVANAKNAAIKDGAVTPKTSTSKDNEHTYAKMATENNKNNSSTKNIKDYYKNKN